MKSFILASLLMLSTKAFSNPVDYTFPYLYQNNNSVPRTAAIASVDEEKQTIIIKIYKDICGTFLPPKPNEFRCMAMANLERTYELKLTEKKQSCGSQIFYGYLDQAPVDGPTISFKLQDNTQRLCDDLVPGASAQLNIKNNWTNQTDTLEMTTDLLKD